MCRERTNFPELGLAVNQIKRNLENALSDTQEWKNYSIQQKQVQVADKLNLAEESFQEMLKLLEETLFLVNKKPVEENQEVTINVIRK